MYQRLSDGHTYTPSEAQSLLRSIDPLDADTPVPVDSQKVTGPTGGGRTTVRPSQPRQVGPFKHGYGNP